MGDKIIDVLGSDDEAGMGGSVAEQSDDGRCSRGDSALAMQLAADPAAQPGMRMEHHHHPGGMHPMEFERPLNRGGTGRFKYSGDYGPVQYGGMSRLQLPTLRTPSNRVPGVEFEWSFQMKRQAKRNRHGNYVQRRFEPIKVPRGLSDAEFLRSDYWAELMTRSVWVCLNCANVTPKGATRILSFLHVRSGRMVSDPENPPNRPHACTATEENILISIVHSVKRRMWRRMRADGDAVGALRDAKYEMTERCRLMDQATLDNMLAQLPDERSAIKHMKLMHMRAEYKALGKSDADGAEPSVVTEVRQPRREDKPGAEAAAAALGLMGGSHMVVNVTGGQGRGAADVDDTDDLQVSDRGGVLDEGELDPQHGQVAVDDDQQQSDLDEDDPRPPKITVHGDFGPAEYGGMTRAGLPSLRSDSRIVPGVEYEWSLITKKSRHLKMPRNMNDEQFLTSLHWTRMMEVSQYYCLNCANLWSGGLGPNRYRVMLTVKNGRMVSDPDRPPKGGHECIATEENIVASIVASVKRRMHRRMRGDGDFRGALRAAKYELSERFRGLPQEQFDEIMSRLPSIDAVARTVRRSGLSPGGMSSTRGGRSAYIYDPVNVDMAVDGNYASRASISTASARAASGGGGGRGRGRGRRAGPRSMLDMLEGEARASRLKMSYSNDPEMQYGRGMRNKARLAAKEEPAEPVDQLPAGDDQLDEGADEPEQEADGGEEDVGDQSPPVSKRGRPIKSERLVDTLFPPSAAQRTQDVFSSAGDSVADARGRKRFRCPAFTACPFKFACTRCGIGFTAAALHSQHMMAHMKGNAFGCASCGTKTRSALGFNDHVLWRCLNSGQGPPPGHTDSVADSLAPDDNGEVVDGEQPQPQQRHIIAAPLTAMQRVDQSERDAGGHDGRQGGADERVEERQNSEERGDVDDGDDVA